MKGLRFKSDKFAAKSWPRKRSHPGRKRIPSRRCRRLWSIWPLHLMRDRAPKYRWARRRSRPRSRHKLCCQGWPNRERWHWRERTARPASAPRRSRRTWNVTCHRWIAPARAKLGGRIRRRRPGDRHSDRPALPEFLARRFRAPAGSAAASAPGGSIRIGCRNCDRSLPGFTHAALSSAAPPRRRRPAKYAPPPPTPTISRLDASHSRSCRPDIRPKPAKPRSREFLLPFDAAEIGIDGVSSPEALPTNAYDRNPRYPI